MKRLFVLVLALCSLCFCLVVQAAGPKYPGWLTVMIPNTAQFDVPPLVEVQTKEYRDIIRKKLPSYPDPAAGCVMLQKKGLLEAARQGRLEPITMSITFNTRDLGQDSGLKRKKLAMTPEDLQDFTRITMKDTMADKNNSYFDWQAATIAKLPCGEAIKLGYKRKYKNEASMQYYDYYIFDGPKLYKMTVAYSTAEEALWCDSYGDIRNIPNTLTLPK